MKGIKWATIGYVLLFLGDLISTLILGSDLIAHLESNPLFKYIGMPGLVILNLGVAAAFYYGYQYAKTPNTRHAIILSFMIVSLYRILIIINNVQVYLDPPTIEVASQVTQAAKNSFYLLKVALPMLMMYLPSWAAFILFSKDHKIEAKE